MKSNSVDRRRRGAILGLLAAAAILGATRTEAGESRGPESNSRAAWDRPAEERLAERFDPAAMKARSDARQARLGALSKYVLRGIERPTAGGPATDTLNGRETPELFLQWELFDQLVNLGFPQDGTDELTTRALVEDRAAALGLGMDLWQRLEAAASPLLAWRRAEARRARASGAPDDLTKEQALRLCRTRARAMAAAKAELGEGPFLALLYGAVAPTFSRTYVVSEGLADQLRFVEGGCR